MWKQETLETLQSASKPEQSSLFVANEPWCFLIIYKPFKRTWWEDQGSQLKRFHLERGQKTLKCFVKWGNNELLPNTEQELSKTAGAPSGVLEAWTPKALFFGRPSSQRLCPKPKFLETSQGRPQIPSVRDALMKKPRGFYLWAKPTRYPKIPGCHCCSFQVFSHSSCKPWGHMLHPCRVSSPPR